MSMDRSLKTGGGLTRHRNVLTRAERIATLQDQDKWDPEKDSVLGLPKVSNRTQMVGKKKKKAKEEEEEAK